MGLFSSEEEQSLSLSSVELSTLRGRFLVDLFGGGGEATAGASDVEELEDESLELNRPLLESEDELALTAGGGAFDEADATESESESSELSSDEEDALGEGDGGRGRAFLLWTCFFLVVDAGAMARARVLSGNEELAEEVEEVEFDDSERVFARFVFGRCRGREDDADDDEEEDELELSPEEDDEESSDEDKALDSSPRTVLTIVVAIVLLDLALSIRGAFLALALVLAGETRRGAEPGREAVKLVPEGRVCRALALAGLGSKISSSDDDDDDSVDVVVSIVILGICGGFALSGRRFKSGCVKGCFDVDAAVEVGFGFG
ncbi:BQ2448_6018 [Microbotryum intermedium]|uniref:BQ2448_6018 protein n=1 Tax=Microbotryum intermedium TaxID=269621 RepID=A0A238EZS8_9BASI|nr:BQ2448_6018 [Microbotryum intermedium]